MNEVLNMFLVAGDKFVPEMHLRQPKFTYSSCGPFSKNRNIKTERNRRYEVHLSKRIR